MKEMNIMYKVYDKYPNYKVYDDGTITDFDGNKLKTFKNNKGYVYVNFKYKGNHKIMFIHRIVAYLFCDGYKDGLQVNHINGVHDDNRACNLEWCTAKQNMRHCVDVLGYLVGEKNPIARAINVYDYNTGKFIAHYGCISTMIREFLCKNLNVKYRSAEQSVYRILKGTRKSYHGYTFRYN